MELIIKYIDVILWTSVIFFGTLSILFFKDIKTYLKIGEMTPFWKDLTWGDNSTNSTNSTNQSIEDEIDEYIYNNFERNRIRLNEEKIKADFNDNTRHTLIFFDNYLKSKYEFYLLNDFMPYFLANKEITASIINETKEKFFLDVSTSLNENLFDTLGTIYTKAGLQLYVHQQFLGMYNKSTLLYKDDKKIDKRIIDAVMGE